MMHEPYDFARDLEEALRQPSDQAANEMIARGRTIVYVEADTPPDHVIREYPDGTKQTVRVDLDGPQSSTL